jgi:hypothetical protein
MLSIQDNTAPAWRLVLLGLIILLGLVSIISSGGSSAQQPLQFDNGQAAEGVIGQTNFVDILSNQGGAPDADTIASPYGNVIAVNGVLYVSDYGNNRVLGFHGFPGFTSGTVVIGPAANFVLGQVDFMQATGGLSAAKLDGPQAPDADAGRFVITDYNNNRVLIYNSIPTVGPGVADIAVGQDDLTSSDFGCTASRLDSPETTILVNGKLVVTDTRNHRVLIWNTIPGTSGEPADIVLGQPDFRTCLSNNDVQAGGPSARTLDEPAGAWSDGRRLVVIDSLNNRVLIWNTFPTASYAPADLVLGQTNFTNIAGNDVDQDGSSDGAPDSRTLAFPYDGIDFSGRQLCVVDGDNNRVLIWDTFPTVNFQPADRVLGQPDFVSSLANDATGDGSGDDPSAVTLDSPNGCYFLESTLIVGDQGNNRVLIYRSP